MWIPLYPAGFILEGSFYALYYPGFKTLVFFQLLQLCFKVALHFNFYFYKRIFFLQHFITFLTDIRSN